MWVSLTAAILAGYSTEKQEYHQINTGANKFSGDFINLFCRRHPDVSFREVDPVVAGRPVLGMTKYWGGDLYTVVPREADYTIIRKITDAATKAERDDAYIEDYKKKYLSLIHI